jgi:hypothetical protein
MSDRPSTSSVRTWVLRDGGLPLEERTVELSLEPIIIDDTPGRQALFFAFDGPVRYKGVTLNSSGGGGQSRGRPSGLQHKRAERSCLRSPDLCAT